MCAIWAGLGEFLIGLFAWAALPLLSLAVSPPRLMRVSAMSGPGSVTSDVLSSSAATSSSRSGTTSPDGDFRCSQWSASLSPLTCFADNLLSDTLSHHEISQIEAFHKGLHSQVYVCPAVASLYVFVDPAATSKAKQEVARNFSRRGETINKSPEKTGWTLHMSQVVPVIVLVTRPDKNNALYFVLSDRRTGFPLWRDTLSAESKYQAIDIDYHEFQASSLNTRVGLRLANATAATKMLQHVLMLTVNPSVFGQHGDRKKKKAVAKSKKKTVTPPQKNSISPPCCFTHVAHVAKDDHLFTLTEFGKDHRLIPK